MKGQKLAIYIPSLRGGGAERIMVTLANAFFARGYTVDLVLGKAEGPYLVDVFDGVRIVDLNASRVITSLHYLVRYMRKNRPTALLSAMGHANVVAITARALARVPIRVVVSERAHFSSTKGNNNYWFRKFMGLLMRWAFPRADNIVAISGGVADDLAESLGLARHKIQVVYNPAVTPKLIKSSYHITDHPWLRAGAAPVILGVGRLVPVKNFVVLIKAFKLVHQQHDARLLILGEGPLRGELEEMVKNMGLQELVDLPGFVRNPYPYMRQAKMFVFSSLWEGFGNVLVESMACGTPVVSTNCPGGPAEILENGKWGRLTPVGDTEALANAMIATLEEEKHPDVALRAADFNVDQAVKSYLDALLPESMDVRRET